MRPLAGISPHSRTILISSRYMGVQKCLVQGRVKGRKGVGRGPRKPGSGGAARRDKIFDTVDNMSGHKTKKKKGFSW